MPRQLSIILTRILVALLALLAITACSLSSPTPSASATPPVASTQTAVALPTTTASETVTPIPASTNTATPVPVSPTPTTTFTITSTPTQTPQPQPPVWVRNPNDSDILNIDPTTNTIQAKVAINGGVDLLIATGNALWVANQTALYRVSPVDGQIMAKTALAYPAVTLAAGQSAIWVGMMVLPKNQPPGTEFSPSGKIARVNPDTAQIEGTVDTACSPKAIGAQSAEVWVTSGCFNLAVVDQIDPKTMQRTTISNKPDTPADPAKLPASIGGSLAMASDVAWMVSADGTTVYRLDPATHKITTQSDVLKSFGTTPVGIASGAGLVWLALTDGKVLGLDPAALNLVTLLDLKKQLTSVDFAFGQGAVWVNDPTNAILTRIDPASKQVVASLSTGTSYSTPTPQK